MIWSSRANFETRCRAKAIGYPLLMVDGGWGWTRVLEDMWIIVDTNDKDIAPWLISDGFWESWVTLFASKIVKSGDLCIDVGANYGYYSALFRKLDADVVAIEANPKIARRLGLWLPGTIHGAAWDKTGETLYLGGDKNRDGNSSVKQYGEYKLEVKSIAIDSLNLTPDLIKVDTEGAEPEFWAGAEKTLDLHKPCVIMEYAPGRYSDPRGFASQILEAGYITYRITYDGWVEAIDLKRCKVAKGSYLDLYLQHKDKQGGY